MTNGMAVWTAAICFRKETTTARVLTLDFEETKRYVPSVAILKR